MLKPWLDIPAENVRIIAPICREDDWKLLFKDVEAIDKTIADLQELKVLITTTTKAGDKNDT